MALIPYSVSPRRIDQSRGPKPTKYSVTFMPPRLAARRWPSSWIITITMMATITISRSTAPARTATATMSATATSSSTADRRGDFTRWGWPPSPLPP